MIQVVRFLGAAFLSVCRIAVVLGAAAAISILMTGSAEAICVDCLSAEFAQWIRILSGVGGIILGWPVFRAATRVVAFSFAAIILGAGALRYLIGYSLGISLQGNATPAFVEFLGYIILIGTLAAALIPLYLRQEPSAKAT